MNSSVIRKRIRKRGLYLGMVPEMAAARDSPTLLTLDHDLDVLPEVGRQLTVAELAGHVDDLAGRLRAAGVRPGEHVVICKAANFDVWVLGADLTRQVISVTGSRPGAVSLAELAGSPPVQPVFQGLDEPALITHTSGTTGLPKLVVHTPRTIRIRLRPQLVLLALMRKRETVAIHIPFGHSRNFAATALCLSKAMPVLLVNNPDPDHVARFFARHQPGLIEALPNSFLAWEDLTSDPRQPFASVKYFSSTFDAIHPRTISRLLESSQRRAPLFFQIYGQSEVGPAIGRPYFRRSAHRMDGRCVGYQMPRGPRVRVVSRDGRRPSRTNPGFIEVRWKGLLHTYLGEQDKFDANLHAGWWRMGDVGYRTRLGCLHMLDRELDVIPGVGSTLEIEDLVRGRLAGLTGLVAVPGPRSGPVPVICPTQDQPRDPDRGGA